MKLDLEAMEAQAAEHLLVAGKPLGWVAFDLAQKYPKAPALSICFAFACVASGLEATTSDDDELFPLKSIDIYRVVAVISAEIMYLGLKGDKKIVAEDLLSYWEGKADDFFLSNRKPR